MLGLWDEIPNGFWWWHATICNDDSSYHRWFSPPTKPKPSGAKLPRFQRFAPKLPFFLLDCRGEPRHPAAACWATGPVPRSAGTSGDDQAVEFLGFESNSSAPAETILIFRHWGSAWWMIPNKLVDDRWWHYLVQGITWDQRTNANVCEQTKTNRVSSWDCGADHCVWHWSVVLCWSASHHLDQLLRSYIALGHCHGLQSLLFLNYIKSIDDIVITAIVIVINYTCEAHELETLDKMLHDIHNRHPRQPKNNSRIAQLADVSVICEGTVPQYPEDTNGSCLVHGEQTTPIHDIYLYTSIYVLYVYDRICLHIYIPWGSTTVLSLAFSKDHSFTWTTILCPPALGFRCWCGDQGCSWSTRTWTKHNHPTLSRCSRIKVISL